MSAYLYGKTTRLALAHAEFQVADDGNTTPAQQASDLAQRVSALVPADVLVLYGVVLASATSKNSDGTTTVTNPSLLKWSIPILAVLNIVLYFIGRAAGPGKSGINIVRSFIPAFAFLAWTLLTATAGLTLWFSKLTGGWEFLAGGVIGIFMIYLAMRLTPKTGDAA